MTGTYYIDQNRLTGSANVSCSMDDKGINVVCNYDYDEILGTRDSKNLYNTKRTDDNAWNIAMNIANMLQYRYQLPLVITYAN